MKTVGFIREQNPIKIAVPLATLRTSDEFNLVERKKVCEYLDEGVIILAWMTYFFDPETKSSIAPDCYYSDGVWVWPSYYRYYIQKYPDLRIDPDFLDFLRLKNFKIEVDPAFRRDHISFENQLAILLQENS